MACENCSHYWDCYDMSDYAPPASCVMNDYRYFSPSIDYLKEREKQNKKKYVYVDGVKCELITV